MRDWFLMSNNDAIYVRENSDETIFKETNFGQKKKGAGGFPRVPNRNIHHVHPLVSQFVVVAMHGSCLSDLFCHLHRYIFTFLGFFGLFSTNS